MPIYDFRCASCGAVFDALVREGKLDKKNCPNCGCIDVKKLISPINLPMSGPTP